MINIGQFIIVATLILHHSCLLIERKPVWNIEVEMGNSYSYPIPTIFHNYQYSALSSFYNLNDKVPSNVCQVVVDQQGTLTVKSSQIYSKETVGNRTQQWLEDTIIFKYEDLQLLRPFSDAIYFKGQLYAFFTSNQGIVYNINQMNGVITSKQSFYVNNQKTEEAFFVVCLDRLLLISMSKAVVLNEDGTLTVLSKFNGTEGAISDIKSKGDKIFIGKADKGLSTYQFNQITKELIHTKTSTFAFKNSKEIVPFSVDQFDFDTEAGLLYVLDYTEGLLQVPLNHLQQFTEIKSPSARLLVSGCENIVVLEYSIFVTCPELIQIDKINHKVKRIIHNTFYAYKMEFVKQRLYLYGRKTFAVYDLFGKVIDEYALKVHSEMSMVVGDHLVSFGDFGVVSEYITPQKQAFQCYFKQQKDLGVYSGVIVTEGICRQYLDDKNKKNISEICTLEYPIQVNLKDTYPLDLSVQIYLLLGWVGTLLIIGIFLATHHCITIHKYKPLKEEEWDQLKDISKNTVIKESKTKEVVLNTQT